MPWAGNRRQKTYEELRNIACERRLGRRRWSIGERHVLRSDPRRGRGKSSLVVVSHVEKRIPRNRSAVVVVVVVVQARSLRGR